MEENGVPIKYIPLMVQILSTYRIQVILLNIMGHYISPHTPVMRVRNYGGLLKAGKVLRVLKELHSVI